MQSIELSVHDGPVDLVQVDAPSTDGIAIEDLMAELDFFNATLFAPWLLRILTGFDMRRHCNSSG